MSGGPHPNRTRVIAAFLAIYIVWGSTYLFMRFTVETVPPLGMSGLRFFIAGSRAPVQEAP